MPSPLPSSSFTLLELRAFLAVVDQGSFSAAGRTLGRVQSAISTAIANLEADLGVTLFDRSARKPTLTPAGRALAASARRLAEDADALRTLASDMTQGLEPMVSVCADALFPVQALVLAAKKFAAHFPQVDLRVQTETLSAVSRRVLDGRATLGLISPTGVMPGLTRRALTTIRMVPVCGPSHPLAARRGRIPASVLGAEVQIVLSERDQGDGLPDQAVLSRRTWRVSDLLTKLAMIRADLGWGNLPQYLVADDLAKGTLVQVHPLAWSEDEHVLSLAAVVREGSPPGPAHAWLMDALEHECSLVAGGAAPAASVSTKARSPSAKRKPVPHAGGIGRRTR